jgi:hypothetical protein
MKRAIALVAALLACGILADCDLNPQPQPPADGLVGGGNSGSGGSSGSGGAFSPSTDSGMATGAADGAARVADAAFGDASAGPSDSDRDGTSRADASSDAPLQSDAPGVAPDAGDAPSDADADGTSQIGAPE